MKSLPKAINNNVNNKLSGGRRTFNDPLHMSKCKHKHTDTHARNGRDEQFLLNVIN